MILVLLVLLGAYTNAGRESRIIEGESAIRLLTDDGLELVLGNGDGRAISLSVGRVHSLIQAPMVRFEEVVEDPDAPDLLADMDWHAPVDESVKGHGGKWIRVSGRDGDRPRMRVDVGRLIAGPLVLSGWCQAQVKGEAFGWINRHLALNAVVTYADGECMPEVSAYFGQYDHGPQFNKRIICPDRPIGSVDIDLSVPGRDCTAWYRDVKLRPARYLISTVKSPLERIDHLVQQEFSVTFTDPNGPPARSVPDAGSVPHISPHVLPGTLPKEPALPEPRLRGLITYQPKQECIEMRCSFESTEPIDRAVSAWFAIPVDAIGGVWWDDARTKRTIEAGKIYRAGKWYGAGRDGWNSRYPFACIETAGGTGLALGTSVEEPRVFQTEYDAGKRELRIRFDIGLSPDAGRWANRGSFTACTFTFQDGFRGATEKYHRMFPRAFENRVEKQGLWLPFMTPTAVVEHEDFHFRFLESVGHMGWDESQGMLSFRYVEPWIHHQEKGEEVRGAIDPQASIKLAERMASMSTSTSGMGEPLDIRRRYPAYLGSYIEDQWGNPQGYFFRSASGGRNENMMIVNPNDRLPPPPGSAFSSGGWDWEIVRETMGITSQWSLPGWTLDRVGEHPFLEVEERDDGNCIRLDPARGKSQYEQHYRGITQIVRAEGATGLLTFFWSACGESVPEVGTGFSWRITCWFEDGTSIGESVPLADLGREWRRSSHTIRIDRKLKFVSVSLQTPARTPDPTVLRLDDVSLLAGDRELLVNGGFEEAELLPGRLDGVYLDTMECYEANLNYRRAHWQYAEEPLTFDCARRPAMHQVFSHITFARHTAEWMHSTGRLTFGNCVPVTPFAAPHLDIMGTEFFWKHGGRWAPMSDADFNFARFMCRHKPYCGLQYSDFSVEEQTRYVKRCLFYGVFPSNQGAPSGGWYWADPMVVEKHRPVFAKYVPTIIEIAEAGWEPVTLARTDDPDAWIERFGKGESFYLTVFNSTDARKSVNVTLDPRCGLGRRSKLTDVVRGKDVQWKPGSFKVELDPEDVAVYRVEVGRIE